MPQTSSYLCTEAVYSIFCSFEELRWGRAERKINALDCTEDCPTKGGTWIGNDCSYKSSRRSSHVSTGHLVALPNTSTLLSTQGMMLPGMLIEQLAIFMMSSAFKTLSHILNWLISPTKAWVASNLPPTVSFRHTRVRLDEKVISAFCSSNLKTPQPHC